jgi:rare lipoprotein A (peptidoglycan hydrolase)
MRSKNSMTTGAVLLALLFFFLTPAITQPLAAPARGLSLSAMNLEAAASPLATPNPNLKPKPLKTWECVSSWYGEDFDGQQTANGETYDMFAVTAAHPTLPLGSIVRVSNLKNNRSLIVRINDRGPYVDGRGLDVSYEVARRLGFDHSGLAKVRLELLEVPTRPAATHPE